MYRLNNGLPLITLMILQAVSLPAEAADTTEVFDVGATDVEVFAGYDGIGPDGGDHTICSDLVLGFGLSERLSAFLGTTLQGDQNFAGAEPSFGLGIFGTVVDSEQIDLDLFMEVGTGGSGFEEFQISPSVELNMDNAPDMSTWGAYLRAGLPVYGRSVVGEEMESTQRETAYSMETTLGAYYTLSESQQLLLEYESASHYNTALDESTGSEGMALGYNMMLTDTLELVNQVHVDIPRAGETTAMGLTVGIIATMPSAHHALELLAEQNSADEENAMVAETPTAD